MNVELLERDSEFPRDGDARGRNWVALALHLAAVIPYYFAIQSVISVGQTQSTQVRAYWDASDSPREGWHRQVCAGEEGKRYTP